LLLPEPELSGLPTAAQPYCQPDYQARQQQHWTAAARWRQTGQRVTTCLQGLQIFNGITGKPRGGSQPVPGLLPLLPLLLLLLLRCMCTSCTHCCLRPPACHRCWQTRPTQALSTIRSAAHRCHYYAAAAAAERCLLLAIAINSSCQLRKRCQPDAAFKAAADHCL